MSEHAIFAIADAKDLLHQREAFAHRTAAGIGTEVATVAMPGAGSLVFQRRIRVVIGHEDERVGLVVA